MLRVFYGGPVTPAQDVLVNQDGTHRSLGGQEVSVFLKNEHLTALATKLESPQAVDATLTKNGPIIFYWHAPQGFHASVIVDVQGRDIIYHDPAIGPGQRMSMDRFQLVTAAGLNGKGSAHIRDPNTALRWASSPHAELVLASDGVKKKYPLPWPTGWWRVWDGGTWYYYLADGGIAMTSRTPPSPPTNTDLPAKARMHNTGTWRTSSNSLLITWKQVAGAPKPCEETFWNATEECLRMNATSNIYSPLVATRFPG